ncbi:MAG: 3-oxoadipate enol-lactonase [Anaerolineae bacterium]
MPTITINGVTLYYELHGDGPEVLALNNGVIASTGSWAYQLPALTPHFRVLLYDMRGQGRSGKWQPGMPDFTWEQHADDLAALLDALDIPAAHIGGISYGGELTLVFALRYPDRCKTLIVADAVSQVDPYLQAVIESWIMAAATGDPEYFYRSTWFWNFSPAYFAARYDFLLSRIDAARALDLPSVVQLCRCFNTLSITGELSQIQKPTCVIVGDQDILKPPSYARLIADNIPGAELHILPEAGHASFWEQPEAFNSVVLGFLHKSQL